MTREQWAGLRAQEHADDEKTMFEICESGDERKCAERVEWLTIPQAREEGELKPASRNIASLVELALVTEVGTQLCMFILMGFNWSCQGYLRGRGELGVGHLAQLLLPCAAGRQVQPNGEHCWGEGERGERVGAADQQDGGEHRHTRSRQHAGGTGHHHRWSGF